MEPAALNNQATGWNIGSSVFLDSRLDALKVTKG